MPPAHPVVALPLVGVDRRPLQARVVDDLLQLRPAGRRRGPPGGPRPTPARRPRRPAAGRWRRCRGRGGGWPAAAAGRPGRRAGCLFSPAFWYISSASTTASPSGLRSSPSRALLLEPVPQLQQVLAVAAQLAGQLGRGGRLGDAAEDQQQLGRRPPDALQGRAGEGVEDAAAVAALVVEDRVAVAAVDAQAVAGAAARAGQAVGVEQLDELARSRRPRPSGRSGGSPSSSLPVDAGHRLGGIRSSPRRNQRWDRIVKRPSTGSAP